MQEEAITRGKEHTLGAKPHGIREVSEVPACIGSEFDSEMFSSPREKAHTTKAPQVPLPIVSSPFEKTAMDIVGPLPRSRSGHCYILVMCDYATRYPEAHPTIVKY